MFIVIHIFEHKRCENFKELFLNEKHNNKKTISIGFLEYNDILLEIKNTVLKVYILKPRTNENIS